MLNLNTLSEQEIQALAQVSLVAQGKVLQILADTADDIRRQLVRADDMVLIHRLQGRAEMLDALIAAVKDAVNLRS